MLNLSIDSWHLCPSINYTNIYVAGCLAARQTWTAFPSFFPICYETDSCQWNVDGIDEGHLWLRRLRSRCVPSPPFRFPHQLAECRWFWSPRGWAWSYNMERTQVPWEIAHQPETLGLDVHMSDKTFIVPGHWNLGICYSSYHNFTQNFESWIIYSPLWNMCIYIHWIFILLLKTCESIKNKK